MITFYVFLAMLFAYWMGRDANKRPYQKGDYLAPVVIIWALLGCFSVLFGISPEVAL